MGANNADISRNMHDEFKEYQRLVYQQGKPAVDADFNDSEQIIYNLLRRFIQSVTGNGSPNLGFKASGYNASNDVSIGGGDGTIAGAGRILVEGFQCILPNSTTWKATSSEKIHAKSTGLTATVLTDTAANFTVGGADDNLVGRELIPDITQASKIFTITANTQTTITISGDMLANGIEQGDHYRLQLSEPVGGGRTDEAYLDVYLDEIDGEEDEDIKHILGMQIETHLRLKLIHVINIVQGGVAPTRYVDFDGNQHEIIKLATIQRYDGQGIINAGDVTDERHLIRANMWTLWEEIVAARGTQASIDDRLDVSINEDGTMKAGHGDLADMPDPGAVNSDHDARYVNKAGDVMTGNLSMSGAQTVDGRDVSVDGTKLDGIEDNATRDQTASEILDLVKTVDGAGSGLDADKLDGKDSTQFLEKTGGQMSGNITMAGAQTVDGRDLSVDGAKLDGIESNATRDQTALEILNSIKTVDGSGSGLDADLLDGKNASEYEENIEVKVYKVSGSTNVLTLLSGVTFSDGTSITSLSQVRCFGAVGNASHDTGIYGSYNATSGNVYGSHGMMVLLLLKKNGWSVSGANFSWDFNNYT